MRSFSEDKSIEEQLEQLRERVYLRERKLVTSHR